MRWSLVRIQPTLRRGFFNFTRSGGKIDDDVPEVIGGHITCLSSSAEEHLTTDERAGGSNPSKGTVRVSGFESQPI